MDAVDSILSERAGRPASRFEKGGKGQRSNIERPFAGNPVGLDERESEPGRRPAGRVGGKIVMGEVIIRAEIIPLEGVEIDITAVQREILEIAKKHPGVNINTWVCQETTAPHQAR